MMEEDEEFCCSCLLLLCLPQYHHRVHTDKRKTETKPMILFPESFTQKSLDNHFFHGYKGNLENYFMEDVLILKRQLCYLRNLKESHTKIVGTSCVEYQTETFWRRIDIQEVLQHSENRFVYKGTTIENITCKHTICQGLEFFL